MVQLFLVCFVVTIIGLVGWYVYHRVHNKMTNPIMATTSQVSQTYWLINDGELQNIVRAGLSQSLLNYYFNNPKTLLIITNKKIDNQLTNAQWVEPFTTLSSIQAAISDNSINAKVKYILYDNEGWSLTPRSEQLNAISYAAQVKTLVNQHGYIMIFTPATNLADEIGNTSKTNKYTEFISLNLAGQAAKVSDILDIQSQQAEGTKPDEFLSFAPAVLAQAKQSNPKNLTFLGIGTQNCGTSCSPGSRTVTGADILADYKAVNPTKDGLSPDGYWFNIPGPGSKCLNCGIPDPATAVDFFNGLYALPNHH